MWRKGCARRCAVLWFAVLSLALGACTRSADVNVSAQDTTTTSVAPGGSFLVPSDQLESEALTDGEGADVTSPGPGSQSEQPPGGTSGPGEGELAAGPTAGPDIDFSPLTETVNALESAGKRRATKPSGEPTAAEIKRFMETAARAEAEAPSPGKPSSTAPRPSAATPSTTTPRPSPSTTLAPAQATDAPRITAEIPTGLGPGSTQVFTVSAHPDSVWADFELASCVILQRYNTGTTSITAPWNGQVYCSSPAPIGDQPTSIIMTIPDDADPGYYAACATLKDPGDSTLVPACTLYEITI